MKDVTKARDLWVRAASLLAKRIQQYTKGGWFDGAGVPRCCACRKIGGCVVFIIGPIAAANRVGLKIGFDPIKPKDKPFWETDEI